MTSAQDLKNNCTSGELTPKIHRRSDIAQYKNGLATCLNAIASPYGGVYRRFGTKYIAAAKNDDSICVLRKFEFNDEQAYVLEFGENYIRYYKDGAQIVDGTAVETVTTYAEDELRSLRFEQSADVLYIFHKDHAPAQLSRTSHVDWTLADVDFTGGPLLDDNDTTTTLTPSAVTGTGITVTASASVFESGHIGSVWKLSSGKAVSEVTASISSVTSSSAVITGGETVEIEISGTWVATIQVQRSFNNGTDWYNYMTIGANVVKQFTDTRDVQYRVNVPTYTSGTVVARLSVLDDEGNGQGTIEITAVASGTSATATVIDELRSTDATTIWAEAAWSGKLGYPRAGKIYEGRLICACTDDDPTGVWGSSSLEYTNMLLGTDDDNAFYFSMDAKGGVNIVEWMESWKQLSIGTSGNELRLVSNNGITPSNPPDKKGDSDYGSADIQAFIAGRALIFVDRSERILREYAYDYNSDTFDSNSISTLSEHILNNGGGIVDVAYQQKQDSLIWCVLDDGTMGVLTYVPSQQVAGWSRHELGGTSWVESACCIPGSSGHDELWFSVKRYINGAIVRFIELMNEDETGWKGTVATPVISPDAGVIVDPWTVTMTCSTDGAEIRYTTDGSTPTSRSTLYTGPFVLGMAATSATVKAMGFHDDYDNSALASATYTATLHEFYPAANADCVTRTVGSAFLSDYLMLGTRFTNESTHLAVLFRNVTIDPGTTVISAIVTLSNGNITITRTINSNCHFNNIAAPAAAPTSDATFDALALTTAIASDGSRSVTPYCDVDTPELKVPVQSILDKVDWASGNHMLFVWKDDNTPDNHGLSFLDHSDSSTYWPKLTIYTR